MKFKKIKRPSLVRKMPAPAVVVRFAAEKCPSCGGVFTMRAERTKRDDDHRQIIRYSVCQSCGASVTRIYSW